MPRFKSIIFHYNNPKIFFFAKNWKIFERWGLHLQTPVPPAARGFAPRPPASGGWGLRLQTTIGLRQLWAPAPDPQNSPPLRISGYAPSLKKYAKTTRRPNLFSSTV